MRTLKQTVVAFWVSDNNIQMYTHTELDSIEDHAYCVSPNTMVALASQRK